LRDTELCDELAKAGYLAVAPDCFQGNTTAVIPRAISFVAKAAYEDDWELPLRDLERTVAHLQLHCAEWADTQRIVVAGFCFGGGLALRFADKFPEKVKACAVFYGKPVTSLDGFRANFYGVYGSNDRQFRPPAVDSLEALLKSSSGGAGGSDAAAAREVEIRRYAGQAHAFVEDLACIRRGGDAGDAWAGFMHFLERNCPKIEQQREWGQSYGGCDVCASKLNDDPFGAEDAQPDAWEEMKKRIDAISRRQELEDAFFDNARTILTPSTTD